MFDDRFCHIVLHLFPREGTSRLAAFDDHRMSALRADGALCRRMVWGLIGGKSKADIAEAEGLSTAECQMLLERSGVYLLFNVWRQFLWHQQKGGLAHLHAVVRWALDCVLFHAKKCAVGEGIGRCMVIATFFNIRFAGTLRTLVKLLYATAGRSDDPPPRLGHVRRKLVETMAWGIETGLIEKLYAEVDPDVLYVLDRRFIAAMAKGEISCFDMTPPSEAEIEAVRNGLDGKETIENLAEAASIDVAEPSSVAPIGIASTDLPAASPIRHSPPRLVLVIADSAPAELPPAWPPPLGYVSRFKRRRWPSPPLVRLRPIERAA